MFRHSSSGLVAGPVRDWHGARRAARAAGLFATLTLAGCSSLLPHSNTSTSSPWGSYAAAQKTFDGIVPGTTTQAELNRLGLNPGENPNVTILNYSDIIRRFASAGALDLTQLDRGVAECIAARSACRGLEVDHKVVQRKRFGNFFADFLNFKRKIDINGWRFTGLVLQKDGVVIYKLTGGQPVIHELEEHTQPLGPFQNYSGSR